MNSLLFLIVLTLIVALGVAMLLARQNRRETIQLEDALKYLHACEINAVEPTEKGVERASGVSALKLIPRLRLAGVVSPHSLELTEAGRARAIQIRRAHRLWERYLADDTGYPESEWHLRAERREHELQPDAIEELASQLGHPTYDPHGDPIPGAPGEWIPRQGVALLEAAKLSTPMEICHLEDEPAEIYQRLVELGMYPGLVIQDWERRRDRIHLSTEIGARELSLSEAHNVAVRPVQIAPRIGRRLSDLRPGQEGSVLGISPACRIRERYRLLDLGILPGTRIKAEFTSPSGDPTAYRVRGALIALREEQAQLIFLQNGGALQ